MFCDLLFCLRPFLPFLCNKNKPPNRRVLFRTSCVVTWSLYAGCFEKYRNVAFSSVAKIKAKCSCVHTGQQHTFLALWMLNVDTSLNQESVLFIKLCASQNMFRLLPMAFYTCICSPFCLPTYAFVITSRAPELLTCIFTPPQIPWRIHFTGVHHCLHMPS
jgi:hypothetical protein